MSDHAVKNFAEQLLEADVKKVYRGLCTGERAFRVMKDTLGSRVEQFHVGLEINL